jgi:predicted transcriptional regulator
MKPTLTDSATYDNNNSKDSQLQNDGIEDTLLEHIEDYPGLRYRQLLRLTNIVNGVLSYHLSRLERSDQIRVNRTKSK